MKISKRDLKRLISENMFEADSEAVATGAKKSKAGDTPADAASVRGDIKDATKRVVDDIIGSNAFNATINIGRTMVTLRKVTPADSETRKKIKKALKDDKALTISRKDLKILRAVKVNYNKEADKEAKVVAEEVVVPVDKAQSTPAGLYDYDEDGYDYKVDPESGCWLARKKPGGKWFSMRKYPGNMEKLDIRYGDARTAAQKAKCPAGKGKPSDEKEAADKPQEKPSANPSNNLKDDAIVVLMAHGSGGSVGAQMQTAYEKKAANYAKEVIRIGREAGITVKSAYEMFTNPAEHLNIAFRFQNKYNMMKKEKGEGAALDYAFTTAGGDFDVPGPDTAYSADLFKALRTAINNKYGSSLGLKKPAVPLTESLSHGSLIRNRYRRY